MGVPTTFNNDAVTAVNRSDIPEEKEVRKNDVSSYKRSPDMFLRRYQAECFSYTAVLLSCALIWHFFSSGDASFLMTLSSIVTLAAFTLVAVYIKLKGSCEGISRKMLDCYALISVGRLISVVPFEGYIPYDTTGDHLYQLLEVTIAGVIFYSVYLCRCKLAHTASEADSFQISYIIAASVLLGIAMHPHLNPHRVTDILWAMAHYLEVVACLPQLFMFRKERKIYPWTAHFLAALIVAKFLMILLWIEVQEQLSVDNHAVKQYMGYVVLGLQGIQLLLMGDFMHAYLKCMTSGVGVEAITVVEEEQGLLTFEV